MFAHAQNMSQQNFSLALYPKFSKIVSSTFCQNFMLLPQFEQFFGLAAPLISTSVNNNFWVDKSSVISLILIFVCPLYRSINCDIMSFKELSPFYSPNFRRVVTKPIYCYFATKSFSQPLHCRKVA